MSGINMSKVKINNRSSILKLLNSEGPLSRKDISEKIGLTPAAVSNLIRELIVERVVQEKGEVENEIKKSGRREIHLDINYKIKKVIGIDIGINCTKIAISDLNGNVEEKIEVETKTDIRAEDFLNSIAKKTMELLFHNDLSKDNIIGIGIGIVGVVDPETGISHQAYGIWDYDVNIKEIFKNIFKTKVIVDNNVRALSLAEINNNTEVTGDNILFIKYGPGIGSSLIIDSRIYYGSHNNAGEIGHMILDYDGKKCRCGKKGCLESIVSKNAIFEELEIKDKRDYHESTIDFENMINEYNKSQEQIIKVMNRVSFFIALGISNVISIYDPAKVILHGKAFSCDRFINRIKKELNNIIPKINRNNLIIKSHLKENYISGISIAIDEFFYKSGGTI